MKRRITLIVVLALLVFVVVAGFLRFFSLQASNNEHSIGQGVTVSGNKLPGNLTTSVVHVSHALPSPCPINEGTCLGVRSGDVDGDGKADEVGLTYEAGSTQVVAHVVFATGATAKGVFDISFYVGGNPEWLGLSDINGDGRDEIFMQVSSGEEQLTEELQYYNGSLQKARGTMPSTLTIGFGGSNNVVGIGCRVVGGSSQFITFSGTTVGDNFNPTNSSPVNGTQTVYQADVSGAMLEVSQQTVTTTYGQTESMFGHCSGLSYP